MLVWEQNGRKHSWGTKEQTSPQWGGKPTVPTVWRLSLNHFVRLEEERRRNREANLCGRFAIDRQCKLRRLLHGEIGGLGAFEYSVDVVRSTPIKLRSAGAIGDEAARLYEGTVFGHYRHAVLDGEVHNL